MSTDLCKFCHNENRQTKLLGCDWCENCNNDILKLQAILELLRDFKPQNTKTITSNDCASGNGSQGSSPNCEDSYDQMRAILELLHDLKPQDTKTIAPNDCWYCASGNCSYGSSSNCEDLYDCYRGHCLYCEHSENF